MRWRFPRACGVPLSVAIALTASMAAGQGKPEPAKPAAPAPPTPPADAPRKEPAVVTVAKSLAAALPALEGAGLVAVAPLESDAKPTRPDALAVLVGTQLAGQRGWTMPPEVEPVGSAIARARGAKWVVYVKVRVEAGKLRASADVHPVPATVWARAKNPNPGPIAHAFAEAPTDAEVRSFHEPVPLVAALDFARGKNFENAVLAVACDDFDADGSAEIVSVSRTSVAVSKIRGGKVDPVATKLWSELSPMDPTPLREPIAAAFAAPRGGSGDLQPLDIVVSITDRLKSLRLDANLDVRSSFLGFAIPAGGTLACARFPALGITGPLDRCTDADPAPSRPSVTGRFDAYASAKLVDEKGKPFEVWAGREDGAVEIRDDAGGFARLSSAGAQLAVGDIDQDGKPEIITSLDVDRPNPDAVVVYTWDRSSKTPPKEQLKIPMAAGVHALGVCPPSGAGRTPFVFVTIDEIVVAR